VIAFYFLLSLARNRGGSSLIYMLTLVLMVRFLIGVGGNFFVVTEV